MVRLASGQWRDPKVGVAGDGVRLLRRIRLQTAGNGVEPLLVLCIAPPSGPILSRYSPMRYTLGPERLTRELVE